MFWFDEGFVVTINFPCNQMRFQEVLTAGKKVLHIIHKQDVTCLLLGLKSAGG